jgi:hypothetical protein
MAQSAQSFYAKTLIFNVYVLSFLLVFPVISRSCSDTMFLPFRRYALFGEKWVKPTVDRCRTTFMIEAFRKKIFEEERFESWILDGLHCPVFIVSFSDDEGHGVFFTHENEPNMWTHYVSLTNEQAAFAKKRITKISKEECKGELEGLLNEKGLVDHIHDFCEPHAMPAIFVNRDLTHQFCVIYEWPRV